MSELEKVRAASFLSVLTIALVVLSGLRQDTGFAAPARESIEVCAVTKGALCDDAAPAHRAQGAGAPVRVSDATRASAPIAGEPIADLGSITVTGQSTGRAI